MAGDQVADAEDSILSWFRRAWLEAPAAMGDAGPYNEPLYTMKDGDGLPDNANHNAQKAWARITVRHTGNNGRSINAKRSINKGVFLIQIFYPVGRRTDAGDKVRRLGGFIQEAMHAYRGHVNLKNIALETRDDSTGYKACGVNGEFDYMLFTRKGQVNG